MDELTAIMGMLEKLSDGAFWGFIVYIGYLFLNSLMAFALWACVIFIAYKIGLRFLSYLGYNDVIPVVKLDYGGPGYYISGNEWRMVADKLLEYDSIPHQPERRELLNLIENFGKENKTT